MNEKLSRTIKLFLLWGLFYIAAQLVCFVLWRAASLQHREFYLTADCRTRGFRKGKYLLIPPYDEYLISYKSHEEWQRYKTYQIK